MLKTNPKIDAYISKSASFAQPILNHFRDLVHKTCPELEEKIKWGFPHFDFKGEMMCSMAAFKQHCAFGFWKASMMKDAQKMKKGNEEAMGNYGKVTGLEDLPSDKVIIAQIKEAMKLNEDGIKLPPRKKTIAVALKIPVELASSLAKNKKAKTTFENFPPSHRNEYIRWINEAKTISTKEKRIATTVDWLSQGKSRNWKQEK